MKKLKLEGEIELVDSWGKTQTPEFLAFNPCHMVPTLQFSHDDAIWESNSVMRYLCRTFPEGEQFYPEELRSKLDMVMDWRQTKMYPCVAKVAYIIFGYPEDAPQAIKGFKDLVEDHFSVLINTFLNGLPFIYSDTPTIADLSVGLGMTGLKARKYFWDEVPQAVKEYYQRVIDAFPEGAEFVGALSGMCESYEGEGAHLHPSTDGGLWC